MKNILFIIAILMSMTLSAQETRLFAGATASLGTIDFYEDSRSFCSNWEFGISQDMSQYVSLNGNISLTTIPFNYAYSGFKTSGHVKSLGIHIGPSFNLHEYLFVGLDGIFYKTRSLESNRVESSLQRQLNSFIYAYDIHLGSRYKIVEGLIYYEHSFNNYFNISTTSHSVIGLKIRLYLSLNKED